MLSRMLGSVRSTECLAVCLWLAGYRGVSRMNPERLCTKISSLRPPLFIGPSCTVKIRRHSLCSNMYVLASSSKVQQCAVLHHRSSSLAARSTADGPATHGCRIQIDHDLLQHGGHALLRHPVHIKLEGASVIAAAACVVMPSARSVVGDPEP